MNIGRSSHVDSIRVGAVFRCSDIKIRDKDTIAISDSYMAFWAVNMS